LDEAKTLQAQVKLLNDELTGIAKYADWPISFLPALRSFITPGLVTSFIAIAFSP